MKYVIIDKKKTVSLALEFTRMYLVLPCRDGAELFIVDSPTYFSFVSVNGDIQDPRQFMQDFTTLFGELALGTKGAHDAGISFQLCN